MFTAHPVLGQGNIINNNSPFEFPKHNIFRRGSRGVPYTPTIEDDGCSQIAKFESVSAMDAYKGKSHEELRWEDYPDRDKVGIKPPFGAGILSSGDNLPYTHFPQSGNNTSSGPGGFSFPSDNNPTKEFIQPAQTVSLGGGDRNERRRLSELTNFCVSTVEDFLIRLQLPSNPNGFGIGLGQPPVPNPRIKPFPSLTDPIGLLQFTCTCLSAVQDFLDRQSAQPTPAVSQPSDPRFSSQAQPANNDNNPWPFGSPINPPSQKPSNPLPPSFSQLLQSSSSFSSVIPQQVSQANPLGFLPTFASYSSSAPSPYTTSPAAALAFAKFGTTQPSPSVQSSLGEGEIPVSSSSSSIPSLSPSCPSFDHSFPAPGTTPAQSSPSSHPPSTNSSAPSSTPSSLFSFPPQSSIPSQTCGCAPHSSSSPPSSQSTTTFSFAPPSSSPPSSQSTTFSFAPHSSSSPPSSQSTTTLHFSYAFSYAPHSSSSPPSSQSTTTFSFAPPSSSPPSSQSTTFSFAPHSSPSPPWFTFPPQPSPSIQSTTPVSSNSSSTPSPFSFPPQSSPPLQSTSSCGAQSSVPSLFSFNMGFLPGNVLPPPFPPPAPGLGFPTDPPPLGQSNYPVWPSTSTSFGQGRFNHSGQQAMS